MMDGFEKETNQTTHIEDNDDSNDESLSYNNQENHPVTSQGTKNISDVMLHSVLEKKTDRHLEKLAPLPSTINEMRNFMDPNVIDRIERYKPVFSYDDADAGGVTCFPAAAVSDGGKANSGINSPCFGTTLECVRRDFLQHSNTYHRWGRFKWGGDGLIYEAHMFSLYFEVDFAPVCMGHRHDLENVLVIFRNGSPYKVAVSAHGNYIVKNWRDVPTHVGFNPKVVYHREAGGFSTNGFRFAKKSTEDCSHILRENGQCWNTPPIVSWEYMKGYGGITNTWLQNFFNTYDFGRATAPFKNSEFKMEVTKVINTSVSLFSMQACFQTFFLLQKTQVLPLSS